jgi:hypothetical protein
LLYLEESLLSLDGDISQPLLTLSETETIFILSIDSCIVPNDATDLETIKQQNERYVEVKIKNKKFFFFISFSIYLVM